MQIIAKTKISNIDFYYCKATVKTDIISSIPEENISKIDKNYLGLLKLLAGQEVSIVFDDKANLKARTREKELLNIWNNLSKEAKQKDFYLDKNNKSALFDSILEIFGDGRVDFFVQVETSLADIDKAILDFDKSVSEQFSRYLSRPKEDNDLDDYLL